jgi:hypothetical protein
MAVDFSWEHAVAQYLQIYRNIGAQVGPAQAPSEPLAVTMEDLSSKETKVALPKKTKTAKAKDVPAETEPVQPAVPPVPEAIKADVPKTASKTSKTAAKPKTLDAKKEDKAPKPPKTTKPK